MHDIIEVIYNDTQIPRNISSKLICQISMFLQESNLFTNAKNFSGIRIIINPDSEMLTQAQKINSRVSWIFNAPGIQLSEAEFRNFILRCIHIDLDSSISSILLILMEENSLSHHGHDNTDDDEENGKRAFVAVAPKYSMDKIIMPENTRSQINRAITLVRNQHKIFKEWGFEEIDPHTKTILCFYGAPGTGKTMCAHALANELKKNILIASYASIESKWVGEGPKNLQKIFKDAEEQDAILFFDEADSFLSKRVNNAETGSDKHYNRMSNEMFQLLEDYNGIIIFATNLVVDFDKAFKSRILAFVEFIKPDYEARKKLISIMIPTKLPMHHVLTEAELDELSELSEGFSGREMRKALLTTLAEGALRDVSSFSLEEFKVGFKAVMEETEAVEAEMADKEVKNCLSDYIMTMEENQAIMNICLYMANDNMTINEKEKNELMAISRILNLEIPDFTTIPSTMETKSCLKAIASTNRTRECLKYICSIMAVSSIDELIIEERIKNICEEFNISDKTYSYISFIKQFKTIN